MRCGPIRRPPPRRNEDGSILVEALVSAALMALVLGGMFRVTADSAARHHMVEDRRYALMLARSQLAAVGSAIPLSTGAVEGSDAGEVWRVETSPCGSGEDDKSVGVLYCVVVSVREAGTAAPLVTLSSRRLAPLGA
jgi:Tfp pilus assembly protein PilX